MFSQHASVSKREGLPHEGAAAEVVRRSRYPTRLSMYTDAPDLEVSIEEFETFALDRLQVLRAIEDAQLRGRGEDDVRRRVSEALDKHLPMQSNRARAAARQVISQRRKDHVSHFILRLAFSRTEELRGWFLRQESALLRHRFREADTAERAELLAAAKLQARHLMPEARDAQLGSAASAFYGAQEAVYEVDFERVPDLVARAQVIVRDGHAFVAAGDVAALLVNEFREMLARSLAVCARALPQLGEDERLLPVLQSLTNQSARAEYQSTGAAGSMTADSVDSLAAMFPPCMQHLHGQLQRDHHLRHGSRMQLGLFLKGAGLRLPEALIYWRRAFTNMTDDQFQKGYAYNVRHNYGAEGRRADYTPYSCHRIITSNPPGPGDHHGCPFRHFAADRLRTALHSARLPENDVREISELARAGHCQVACTRHLEARLAQRRQQQPDKPMPDAGHVPSITSPNQYLDLLLTDGRGTRQKSERSADTSAILAGPKPQHPQLQSQSQSQSQPYSYA
ncbi:DNA primase subunit pri2 [Coemansia erecta]|uniref:DNA primase subunit pri2 n=1 Tax=Coemansia asiatica TaxID=1052880 RepID=A0A9W8CHL3_9FUNG|nr:DNA primase subunit pri2 [Coemansia asiatica]KAJ2857034.1 DNA primase subunit pri2 [Coemansia erecta]KAJ2887893.1 DNA primase subunit pri2 [Coemansia asiatica]